MTTDLETQLRETFHAVADATTIPAVPRREPTRVPLRQRFGRQLTALIAVGGLGVIGVGAAAASGAFDSHAKEAFSGNDEVDLSRAVQMAAMPGPAGTTIRAFEAPAKRGYSCIAFTISGDPSYSHHQLGGGCSTEVPDGPSDAHTQSGASVDQVRLSVGAKPTIAMFAIPAFRATSAVVIVGDEQYPLVVSYGFVVGWLHECDYVTGTLVTRDDHGAVLMRQANFGTTPGGAEACPAD